ncbi:MAG: YbaK/EbsC family protein [Burkholderiaceae bacterium]|jgi:prolyl-tRNA editing enzyme YbaK/EbsC (Cys-tRNA(Pro) deacylase)
MSLIDIAKQHGFEVIPLERRDLHLPKEVAAVLPTEDTIVFPVSDEHSDTSEFSARFSLGLEDCANTLILRYTKDQVDRYAAAVTLGSRRLDVNGAVKEYLGAKRLSFARREVATEITGMEFGGITAFGLPTDMIILVDAAVMGRPYVVMGAGLRRTKIFISPALLKALPQVQVAQLSLPQPGLPEGIS